MAKASLPADPPPAPPVPAGHLRVRLRPGGRLDKFTDPQTHLSLTTEWQTVPAARIGPATRARLEVEITGETNG